MSKFFVGQRVRLIKATHPENKGREYRVVRFLVGCWAFDCELEGIGPGGYAHTCNLEPILPEGSAPSVYSFQQLMGILQGEKA